MEKKTRTCAVCRGNYQFCNRCREDSDKPLWYFSFCSENCHDIYDITSKFEDERIDANEAKVQLDKLDLSKLSNFGTSYKNSISKIMNYVSNTVKIKTDDIVIENDSEVVSEENIETTESVIEKKVFKKSKNKMTRYDVEE